MSRYNRLKQPRSNQLSVRGLVVLFLATMAISLMLLLILFNLVFKNIDLNFKTRLPDMAPVPEGEAISPEERLSEAFQEGQRSSSEGNSDGLAAFQRQGVETAVMTVPYGRRASVAETPETTDLGEAASASQGAEATLPEIPEIVVPDIHSTPAVPTPKVPRPATHVAPAEDVPLPPMD